MKRKMFAAALLAAMLSTASFAGRPFLTEDAPTTPKGVFGIEAGIDAKDPSGDIDAGLVFYAGVCESAEIYVEIPTALKSNIPGAAGKIDVFNLGAKWNVIKRGDEQIFTLAANVSNLPKETKEWAYSGALVFSKSAGADVTMRGNFGGNFTYEKFDSYIWGVGAEKPLSDKLSIAAEIHSGATLFDKAFKDNHVTSMLGLAWSVSEKATLDFSVRLPLTDAAKSLDDNNEPMEKAHYAAGITYEF